jgi:membrane-associated phospholipid phosphatase
MALESPLTIVVAATDSGHCHMKHWFWALPMIVAGHSSAFASEPPPAAPQATPADTVDTAHAADPNRLGAPPEYRFEPGTVCPFCELTPQYPEGRSGLHWHQHWRSVGTREYVTISALAAGLVAYRLFAPASTGPGWSSPVLFDTPVRKALRIDNASGRHTAAMVSDVLFTWEVLHPTVIDPLLVAWWQRESPYVAWQMFVIDAQAYALTMVLSDVVKRATSRQRPWVQTADCERNPSGDECGSGGGYRSFYSGHAAVTATGAGLICAHHTQLNLYQNDILDVGTCALAVAGTAVTGAMRIASDNHWASDVIVGHLVGYASGYLLPTVIYYKDFSVTPHDHPPAAPVFAALPLITSESLGMSVLGMF